MVKKGETMWGICQNYYGNPWSWAQLWAYNKGITNPHWIYPGDRIRMLAGTSGPKSVSIVQGGGIRRYDPGPVTLRQNGFADPKDLEARGRIVGSRMEHAMLSLYHEVYVKGQGKFKPQKGETYTIYRVLRKLKSGSRDLGHVVLILGSLRIKKINEHKVATAVITEALDEIRRGDSVGPLRRTFRRLPVRPARKNINGHLIDYLRHGRSIARDDIVFIDRGKNQGVRVGNRFLVMRRGDGHRQTIVEKEIDHEDWPRETIAEIAVLDVREEACVGLITRSKQEVRKGDYVRMRRGY